MILLTATVTAGLTSIAKHEALPGLALVLAGSAYVLFTALSGASEVTDSSHMMAVTVCDIALITTIVWFTGRTSSEYYLLYYLPIAHGAVRLKARDGIAASVLSGVTYAFMSILDDTQRTVVTSSLFRVLAVCVSAALMAVFLALLRREVSLRTSLRAALHDSLRRVAAVYDVAHAANRGADLTAVLSILLEHAAQATGARGGAIALLRPDGQLHPQATLQSQGQEGVIPVDCTSEAAQRAMATHSALTVAGDRLDPPLGGSDAPTIVYMPLITPSGRLGVLGLASRPGKKFGRNHVEFLKTLCAEAALAVENAQLRAELHRMAITDSLTGLLNRREAENRLSEELARAARHSRPLAVLMADVDDLKTVNDHYGHAAGDQVLSALGEVLRTAVRSCDAAGRIGGDEFLLVLPETDSQSAAALADRLVAAFRSRLRSCEDCREFAGLTGLSVGVADSDRGTIPLKQLLSCADNALYEAKRAGKNRSHIAQPAAPAATLVAH